MIKRYYAPSPDSSIAVYKEVFKKAGTYYRKLNYTLVDTTTEKGLISFKKIKITVNPNTTASDNLHENTNAPGNARHVPSDQGEKDTIEEREMEDFKDVKDN